MGCYLPQGCILTGEYVVYHDSPRYGKALDYKLEKWKESRVKAVRNAALTEIMKRKLEMYGR